MIRHLAALVWGASLFAYALLLVGCGTSNDDEMTDGAGPDSSVVDAHDDASRVDKETAIIDVGPVGPSCFPDSGAAVADDVYCPPVSKSCSALNDSCSCKWSCDDGNDYEVACEPAADGDQLTCSCEVNGSVARSFRSTLTGRSACQENCCGFPERFY